MAAEIAYDVSPLNITWPQGTRMDITITADPDYPDAFDAPGTYLRSKWRRRTAAGALLLSLTSAEPGGGITVVDATTFIVSVTAPQMASVGPPGMTSQAYYDIELVPEGVEANARQIGRGTITVVGEATRADG